MSKRAFGSRGGGRNRRSFLVNYAWLAPPPARSERNDSERWHLARLENPQKIPSICELELAIRTYSSPEIYIDCHILVLTLILFNIYNAT
jgi:hypothetical protein